jgi:hypothetical protein
MRTALMGQRWKRSVAVEQTASIPMNPATGHTSINYAILTRRYD